MSVKYAILSLLIAMLPALLPLLCGCSTDGCLNNQNSLPLAGFYSSHTGLPVDIDSVDIGGVNAPGDSLLHISGVKAGEVYLPFRSSANVTSFYFHYTQQNISDPYFNDTITFHYESEPFFASEECGAMYRFRVISVEYTTHIIDSVAVTDLLITNVDIQRIRVYFRTALDDDSPGEQSYQHKMRI